MKFRLLSRTIFPILLLFTLSSSPAMARDYLVEVVLFETVAGRTASTGGLYYPRPRQGLRLGTERAVAEGFVRMEQNLTLADNAAKIAESSRYRLLRHLAWRQPGLDEDNALAIAVSLGETITLYLPDDDSDYEEFIPAAFQPSEGRTVPARTSTLNGTIQVRLGRFLHLDSRLVFTDANTGQSFRLAQSRKMRSGELHYIDNPRFGLLTRITPLEDS